MKKIKDFTLQVVAGANVVTAFTMFLIGLSDRIIPADHPILANIGLIFPGFIIINLCFLVLFAVLKRKYMLISFAGFVISYPSVRTYSPLNISRDVPPGSIKVLSYNVHNFARDNAPEGQVNPILDYIIASDADIVCLQEAVITDSLRTAVKGVYNYADSVKSKNGGECLVLLSKFPIISRERIEYESKNNVSAAFKVNMNGETVTVINNHFETSGLSLADRAGFKDMVKGNAGSDTVRVESKRLAVKLGESAKIRAPQAEAVARYVRKCGKNVILCGDFNDNPISYTHRTLAKELTDCYIESGNGPGISYHHNAIFVRIDNIMCSELWQPYKCKVDRSIGYSDHYPIYCWLKKVEKDKNNR